MLKKELSAGCLLYKKDDPVKYLLLHYEADHWDFPKGHVEANESNEQAALREVKEETGIEDANLIPGFKESISYYYKQQSQTIFKEVVFFLAESPSDKVTLSSEHIGFAWHSFDNAMKKLTYKNAKDVLEKADNFLKAHKI